jgi:hypothetical protein
VKIKGAGQLAQRLLYLKEPSKKMFFSEEKNQKTLASAPAHTCGIWP